MYHLKLFAHDIENGREEISGIDFTDVSSYYELTCMLDICTTSARHPRTTGISTGICTGISSRDFRDRAAY